MNFFTSVFSDDPSHTDHGNLNDSSPTEHRSEPSGAWEFGALWKTLSAKSESIIEIYRRDLQEFGTCLRRRLRWLTILLRRWATSSTTSEAAHRSYLTAKDSILLDSDYNNNYSNNNTISHQKKSLSSRRYSRFDAQVRAIQCDVSTYSEAPEDLEEYNNWKSGFSLEGKSGEMEELLRENEAMDSVYKRVVPSVVDRDTFWFRYYYRVYGFKKAEDVRARLVRRMSRDEEELSWDVVVDNDDDNDNGDGYKGKEGNGANGTKRLNVEEVHKNDEEGSKKEKKNDLLQSKGLGEKKDESVEETMVDKSKEVVQEMGDESKESVEQVDNRIDSGKKVVMERKVDGGKDSLVASRHPGNEKEEEEDFEWDEIEDLSRIDGEKETRTGSPTKVDLRKHLSSAQEQEDENLSASVLHKSRKMKT